MVYKVPYVGYVFNWRSFFFQRGKVYTVLWRTHNTLALGLLAYIVWMAGYTYSVNLNRLWVHYSRKERDRAELMSLIDDARD